MSLESEIADDFTSLAADHGVSAQWRTIQFTALACRVRVEQQIGIGGFVESPDLSLRALKSSFPDGFPQMGDRLAADGIEYRISQVSAHPRSPLLTISLSTTDE